MPTTAASAASGWTGLLRAFLGAAAFLGVGIEQLERLNAGENHAVHKIQDLDQHYETIRMAMQGVFDELGLAA